MNTQSNTYTFLYASIMVVVVAAILSFTALQLKPRQTKNREIEKKQYILKSVNIPSTAATAEKLYADLITDSYVVDAKGQKVGDDAFGVDLTKEVTKPASQRKMPVYIFSDESAGTKTIIPVRGKGLWGPIWGYISLNSDNNSIYGAIFDHKGETPGLGAEISKEFFQKPFVGKQIFDEAGNFTSIQVVKGGASDNIHGVDAISGGTITSKGLEAMLEDCLSGYQEYLKKNTK